MVLENHAYPQDTRVRNEALALRDAGYRVKVIAPRERGQTRFERIDGIDVARFWMPPLNSSAWSFVVEYVTAHVQIYWMAIGALMRGVDVLHCHNPPDTFFPLGLLSRLLGGTWVYDHHDLTPELFAEKFGSRPFAERILRWCQTMSLRVSGMAVVTNESQLDIALSRGAHRSRTIVVRNGPPRSIIGTASGRDGSLSSPRLLFLGALEHQDGVADLPRVLELVSPPGAHLTIVGEGTERASLEHEFASRRLDHQVTFTGWIPHEQVASRLAEADICLDPAPGGQLNHASTMIKIAEYLAAGRPVVAYELRETLRTLGGAGVTVPCDDLAGFASAIDSLAASGPRRAALREQAILRSQSLVWEDQAAKLLGGYRELRPPALDHSHH